MEQCKAIQNFKKLNIGYRMMMHSPIRILILQESGLEVKFSYAAGTGSARQEAYCVRLPTNQTSRQDGVLCTLDTLCIVP